MIRRVTNIASAMALVGLASGCGHATPPIAAKSRAAVDLRPSFGCAEVGWASIGGHQNDFVEADSQHPVLVGIRMRKGRGTYVIDRARVAVADAGTRVYRANESDRGPAVEDESFPAVTDQAEYNHGPGDHDLTVKFDGRDSAGSPLPPGDYEVGFVIASHPGPGCTETDQPPTAVSGLLTTIHYSG